jgi:hypothetical protein
LFVRVPKPLRVRGVELERFEEILPKYAEKRSARLLVLPACPLDQVAVGIDQQDRADTGRLSGSLGQPDRIDCAGVIRIDEAKDRVVCDIDVPLDALHALLGYR